MRNQCAERSRAKSSLPKLIQPISQKNGNVTKIHQNPIDACPKGDLLKDFLTIRVLWRSLEKRISLLGGGRDFSVPWATDFLHYFSAFSFRRRCYGCVRSRESIS